MNSYPAEFLVQLAPVMFVAGLDTPSQQPIVRPGTAPAAQDQFLLLTNRLRHLLESQSETGIYSPKHASTSTSFSRSKSFQITLVSKSFQFPPRKVVPQDDPYYSHSHSILSPLTPSSPLHPDGLISPVWIKKHTQFLPSVFVLFLRMYEAQTASTTSSSDSAEADYDKEGKRAEEERKKDLELSTEIALRKRSTSERGIKLTVVLMASRKMLDSPSLEPRLTYVRRQSGLDTRAALFVLSPVGNAELGEFVGSLQDALYDSSLEFYTNHSKRVRRKRNRHSHGAGGSISTHVSAPGFAAGSSVAGVPVNPAGIADAPLPPIPLRPEGWTFRYEFKMGVFAEFRGEHEVALRHYQTAYQTLTVMFGSTSILQPRTKRWAEAKVIVDCLSLKITKLYLYNAEFTLALSQHHGHVSRFSDFSRGWGIGEETFEFWRWIARQYRVLAELLELGTQSSLILPTYKLSLQSVSQQPRPGLPASSSAATTSSLNSAGVADQDDILSPSNATNTSISGVPRSFLDVPGLNPCHYLQHPGYYYYMSARCTEKRRERFLEMERGENHTAPGHGDERKVDHLMLILELYLKSYELFKKYSSPMSTPARLTLWIAYRTAETYREAGKYDMACRFFEHIGQTYRKEKWDVMLRPLLATWYTCAKQLEDVERTVLLLLEMLGYDDEDGDHGSTQEDLLAVLQSTVPSSPDPLLFNSNAQIFSTSSIFWNSSVEVEEPVAFQVAIRAPSKTDISLLSFESVIVHFGEKNPPLILRHKSDEPSTSSSHAGVTLLKIGHIVPKSTSPIEIETNLRWKCGDTLVLAGTISSYAPTTIQISKIIFTLREGSWTIKVSLDPNRHREGTVPGQHWLRSVNPVIFIPITRDDFSTVTVCHRPHQLQINVSHQEPALLDEEYPIVIEITNRDDRKLDVGIDVLLQPTEIDEAVNQITFDGQHSSSLIKGIHFGVITPGVTISKTLYLFNSGAPGDRTIDLSIQSRSASHQSSILPDESFNELSDVTETLQTLAVATVSPFKVDSKVVYRRALGTRCGIADLRTYESDYWDDMDGGEATITTKVECAGAWGLRVESCKLIKRDSKHAKIIDSFLDDGDHDGMFSDDYLPGDEFSDICRISLAPQDDLSIDEAIPSSGEYEILWRKISTNGELGNLSTTRFALPALRPPVERLIALLTVPSTGKLHIPMPMSLTIRNRHPSRSANITVQLELDPLDGFVVSGLRSGRIPILLPAVEQKLTWNIIPIECGFVKLPRIKVVDRRDLMASGRSATVSDGDGQMEGSLVKVIDVRMDQRQEEANVEGQLEDKSSSSVVLILP